MSTTRTFLPRVLLGALVALTLITNVSAQDNSQFKSRTEGRIKALLTLLDGKHTPGKIRTAAPTLYGPSTSSKGDEKRVKGLTQLCTLFGGANFNTVSINEKKHFWMILAPGAPAGEGSRMQIFFDEEPPYFIRTIYDTVPLLPPKEATKKAMTDAEIADTTRKLAQENASSGEFSGAVAVSNGREMIVAVAHGMANRQYGVPNAVNTRFNMASMAKMFTAVGVCQLMQRGLIKPTDTLAMHVPEVADTYQGKVTIHQLLTHTGGTGRMFGLEELDLHKRWIHTVSEITKILIKEPKLSEPGGDFSYSNSGFVWLGRLIETVTGQDYYDYMDEHVLKPAGMDRTGWYEQDTSVPDIAVGYTRVASWGDKPDDEPRENRLLLGAKGSPAGGAYSTVGDMLKFSQALRNNTLLDAKHTALMLKEKINSYAYGFHSSTEDGARVNGHSGGFNGVGAHFWFYPETGYTLIVFSNQDSGASPIAVAIQAMILNR